MKTIEELLTLTQTAIRAVAYSEGAGAKESVAPVRAALAERGLAPNCHIGTGRDLTLDEQVEWYAGQFVNIVDREMWPAMIFLTSLLGYFHPAKVEAP